MFRGHKNKKNMIINLKNIKPEIPSIILQKKFFTMTIGLKDQVNCLLDSL